MLVIPVTTFGLGTWQVFRLQWKLGLIDELERKTTEDPITMPNELVTQIIGKSKFYRTISNKINFCWITSGKNFVR